VPNAEGNVTDKFWKRQWMHSRGEFRLPDILARATGYLPDPPGFLFLIHYKINSSYRTFLWGEYSTSY
jgi:hypothetical protein